MKSSQLRFFDHDDVLPHQITTMTIKIKVGDFTEERSDLSWSEALRYWEVEDA